MPQGGIDPGETAEFAAWRELREETGITSAVLLAEAPAKLTYLWPPYDGPPHRLARFRGQIQTWFAFRFTGEEHEIVLDQTAGAEVPEFDEWRWERLDRLPELVVSYKRDVYRAVVAAFSHLAGG